jgi:hypothetical protein
MTGVAAVGARGLGKSVTDVFTVVRFRSHVVATATNDANLVPGFRHAMRRISQQLPDGRRIRSEELTQKEDAQFTFYFSASANALRPSLACMFSHLTTIYGPVVSTSILVRKKQPIASRGRIHNGFVLVE